MHELTAYFTTTDRIHAQESLASLESQGLEHPIVVTRNVRPVRAAYLPTLECQTPYLVLLDDDVVLKPGVVRSCLDEFRSRRSRAPQILKLNAKVFSEASGRFEAGGFKMFYTPHLVEVGWPSGPHLAHTQAQEAAKRGFTNERCDIEVGVQKAGTPMDVYKKFLWIGIRSAAGQRQPVELRRLIHQARIEDSLLRWLACLGVVDARRVGIVKESKDEAFLGPLGSELDFDEISAKRVRDLVLSHAIDGIWGRNWMRRAWESLFASAKGRTKGKQKSA